MKRQLSSERHVDIAVIADMKRRNSRDGQGAPAKGSRWTQVEDEKLQEAIKMVRGEGCDWNWRVIANHVPSRDHAQCFRRWSQVLDPAINKGGWSKEEDNILMEAHKCNRSWQETAKLLDKRTTKQARERFKNILNPDVKRGRWSMEEDRLLMEGYKMYQRRWSMISKMIPGRTQLTVRDRWRTLEKSAARKGCSVFDVLLAQCSRANSDSSHQFHHRMQFYSNLPPVPAPLQPIHHGINRFAYMQHPQAFPPPTSFYGATSRDSQHHCTASMKLPTITDLNPEPPSLLFRPSLTQNHTTQAYHNQYSWEQSAPFQQNSMGQYSSGHGIEQYASAHANTHPQKDTMCAGDEECMGDESRLSSEEIDFLVHACSDFAIDDGAPNNTVSDSSPIVKMEKSPALYAAAAPSA